MGWIMRRFKYNSETIADFFGGSGSTLIAAEKEEKHTLWSLTLNT